MTQIIVADDHVVMRAGIVALLSADPTITVLGEASNGREAVDLVAAHSPDVALLDLRMPVLDGVAATTEIARTSTRVLILTTYDTDADIERAVEAGAIGY